MKLGPELLLNINELYTMCVDSGLIPISPVHSPVQLLCYCYAYNMSVYCGYVVLAAGEVVLLQ